MKRPAFLWKQAITGPDFDVQVLASKEDEPDKVKAKLIATTEQKNFNGL